jgi:hypothetical protein
VLAVKDGIYGARHLALPENSCMDLSTDFDCSVHIQLRFGGNHISRRLRIEKTTCCEAGNVVLVAWLVTRTTKNDARISPGPKKTKIYTAQARWATPCSLFAARRPPAGSTS